MECRPTYALVDVIVLQLHEAGADGSDVGLLVGEGDATGAFRILQLRIGVDSGVADTAVEPVHDHRQLHCKSGEDVRATELTMGRPPPKSMPPRAVLRLRRAGIEIKVADRRRSFTARR